MIFPRHLTGLAAACSPAGTQSEELKIGVWVPHLPESAIFLSVPVLLSTLSKSEDENRIYLVGLW